MFKTFSDLKIQFNIQKSMNNFKINFSLSKFQSMKESLNCHSDLPATNTFRSGLFVKKRG